MNMGEKVNENENEIRIKNISIFQKDINLTEIEIKDLEIGIFNYTLKYCKEMKIPLNWECIMFKNIYMNKSISIFANLKSDSYLKNINLLEKIQKKEIKPNEIATMKVEEICPEKWNKILDKHMDLVKNAYEMNMASMSDRIVCKKCKGRNVTYQEVQMRSADEPSTFLILCSTCGHRFKF
jgi:DNA-directed RNA polymerase subunit M/transcription elongation factor TFIIS